MIDTDKYEGHTRGPWTIDIHKVGEDTSAIVIESSNCVVAEVEVENKYAEADAQLIADAPLLLAEVIRLREQLKEANDVIQYALEMSSDDDSTRVFEDYLEVIE
jgi:ribosomal protein L24